jgi:hypothetical protein
MADGDDYRRERRHHKHGRRHRRERSRDREELTPGMRGAITDQVATVMENAMPRFLGQLRDMMREELHPQNERYPRDQVNDGVL